MSVGLCFCFWRWFSCQSSLNKLFVNCGYFFQEQVPWSGQRIPREVLQPNQISLFQFIKLSFTFKGMTLMKRPNQHVIVLMSAMSMKGQKLPFYPRKIQTFWSLMWYLNIQRRKKSYLKSQNHHKTLKYQIKTDLAFQSIQKFGLKIWFNYISFQIQYY